MANYNDKSPGPIPNRWLRCPRKSTSLCGGLFLAFKTPLSEKFDSEVPIEYRFPPKMVFSSMKSYKVRIGLWIDLTNTNRFYDKNDIINGYNDEKEVKYLKLSCRGHGETPSPEQTRTFIQLCKHFVSKNPLDCIGVHCTHGFNRTGFLIISYLVEEMDYSVDAAIKMFRENRSPGIYKQDYLEELYRRYDEVQYTPAAPELPSWCIEEDDCDDDELDNNRDNSTNGSLKRSFMSDNERVGVKKPRKEKIIKNPVFMAGVPGVVNVEDKNTVSNIQRTVQNMCNWQSSGFPGSQPVSMDLNNIELLNKKPYRVSWKADGTRYMMLILKENQIYFIDRDNSVFEVEGLRFPSRKNPSRHLFNTLLDGEMVIDKHKGQAIPRYLVYDVIQYDGNNVSDKPFHPLRLKCIEIDIIKPRNDAVCSGLINKLHEPFSIRAKQFYSLDQTAGLLSDKFSKQLGHEPDGLIFQPSIDPYKPGPCLEVLKWKPPSQNSIDFKLRIVRESGLGILPRTVGQLFVGNSNVAFSTIKLNSTLKQLDNKIIECRFENNNWIFMRERTDKSFPNSYDTAQAVMKSIQSPVTDKYLLNIIQKYRYRDDSRMMPPPQANPRQHSSSH